MDVGLYLLKYPFRKVIGFLLPVCKNVDPNLISWFLMPLGLGTAALYYLVVSGQAPSWWILIGIVLGLLRMVIATLDGLVAVTFGKSTVYGDLVNRVTPELCDLMLIPAIVLARPDLFALGVVALSFAWATPFFGLLGAPAGLPVQSVGPVGQTDRLAALMLFSLLEFLSRTYAWEIDFIRVFLGWLVAGGVLTLLLRGYRCLRAARLADQKARESSP